MDLTDRTGDVSNRRLDSWKEIAAFFARDERTVRRWEKERSLPVYRVPGKGRGSVYAFANELADWLKSPNSTDEHASDFAVPQLTPDDLGTKKPSTANAWNGQERRQPDTDALETQASPRKPRTALYASLIVVAALLAFFAFRSSGIDISSLLPNRLSRWLNAKAGAGPPSGHLPIRGHRAPANAEALDLYLKGRYEWSKRSPESLTKAVDYFTQSIVHDPNYAPAYAGLADTYNLLREYTNMPSSEAYPRAIAAAKKAVELDDSLAEAHRSLAFASFYWTWDLAGGEKEFRRAIELNPNDAVAHHWYATALSAIGRYPEALTEIARAQELDPTSVSILSDKAIILFSSGNVADAEAILRQIESTEPLFMSPHRYLSGIAFSKNDYPTYFTEMRRAAELRHDDTWIGIADAAKRGFESRGRAGLLANTYEIEKKDYRAGLISGTDLAETCSLLGKKEEAIQYLRADYEKHDPIILGIRGNHSFDSLHNDPAFRDLISKTGLPPL